MNRRRRDRTSRAAAVIAVNIERRFVVNDQVARAMAALAEMRRAAEELDVPRDPRSDGLRALLARPGDSPAVRGEGHTGAI
jgi:hypothetical protein